jgi:hypothetical protein
MLFGMECRDSSRHGSIQTHGHESGQYREMGRLLPWNTCQCLKKKGIGCSRYVGRREERTATKGMKAVSSKQTQTYLENYSGFRDHEQRLYE